MGRLNLLLCVAAISVFFVDCSKLNVPRVLLPLFNDVSTNFTLEVTDGGCYKWTLSREDVIQLTPLNVQFGTQCSTQVVLSPITKDKKRNTVVVFAEEVRSRQIIPCDVDVDVIHSLQIVTRTRELYVEEAPQRFEVSAYDDQGNQFTTLLGIEMDWAVSSVGTSGIISFMPFKESPYDTPPSVAHFDQIGIRGHIILLEGIKTGTAKVSVKLPQKEYRHINPVEVQLMVVANLLIDPADVYLLPGDSIKYRILQIRHGRLHEIELPSSQYYLEMEDTEIASIDSYSSEAQALQVGRTKISLRDRNVDPNVSGLRVPQATINVALPAFIHLVLLPHRHWSVLVDDKHVITVEVFDRSNHKFHINDGRVDVTVPSELFHVDSTSVNGTFNSGWAVKPGTARVQAVLKGVVTPRGTEYLLRDKVSTEEDMLIYSRMEIHPETVVLPWDPRIRSRYEVPLQCKGGDGAFIWSSSNTSVATVSASGLVRTNTLGQSTVTAVMVNNPHNQATASVTVLPPSRLKILDSGLEAEIGSPIHLQIAIFAKTASDADDLPFTMCHDLPLTVTISDDNFVQSESVGGTLTDGACTIVTVTGKSLGTTKVTVLYSEGDIVLEDSVMIAAFRPLSVLHPPSGETVLALGTSRQLVFVGGPRPWPGRGSEHGKVISQGENAKSKKDMLEIGELPHLSIDVRDRYVYTVLCRVLGETKVTLTVFSEGRSGQRIESTASVNVYCAKPRFALLKALLKTDGHSLCPMNVNAERVAVQSSRDLELELQVTDVHGRVFDNVTSIHMEWSANPNSLSLFTSKDGTFSEHIHDNGLTLPLRNYQVVQPYGETGAVDITVRLIGYRSAVLRPKQITPEWPPFAIKSDKGPVTPDIRATLSLLFVSDTLVTPNQTILFNHPSSKLILQVSQGSGYFEPQLESQDVANVRYLEHTQTLEIRPISTGIAHFGLVDLCLPSRPATVSITIVGVHSLVVDVADYLQRGKQTLCSVHIVDTMGNPLQLSDLRLLELRPQLEKSSSTIISVKEYESDPEMDKQLGITRPASPGEFRFVVQGLTLGDATLFFTTGFGTYEVRSPPVTIQVFDPLRLYPRNMTLLVGSQMTVGVSGGPSLGLQLEFSVSRPGYVQVSDLGIVEGEKVGYTQLTGQAIGVSKVTGNKIIFSEDSIDVFVVPITGIRIESPLTRLKVDAIMPVWASGLPDPLSPLVLGTTRPALAFEWDLSSREVAEITDVLVETGMEVTDEHRISIRVKALSPGRTTLSLSVFAPPAMTGTAKGELFEESLQLEVYEELRLTQPPSIVGKDFSGLLVAPETQMQLRSNRDGLSRVYYSLQGYPPVGSADSNIRDPSTVLTQQNSILSLSNNGLLTTHSSTGRAAVIVSSIDESNIRQTLGLSVEVKPVHYIMTTVKSALHISPGISAKALPKGLELQLEITYHDNTGSVFAATRTDISVRASRADIVQMRRPSDSDQIASNSTFFSNLVHAGDTVLKISDNLTPSQAADYIKLPIEEFIFPSKSRVAVGDLICFSMPLALPTGEMGHWSSDNPQILSLDHDSGLGRARVPGGPVYVKYHLDDHVVSSTELEVVPITSMAFVNNVGNPLFSSTAALDEVYRVGLILNGESEESKLSNLIVKNEDVSCIKSGPVPLSAFPFSCEARFNSPGIPMQISDVFKIQPVFDAISGRYACELRPIGKLSFEISQLRTNVTLRARAASWAGEAASAPLVLPFLPSFYLDSNEVVLPGGTPGKLEIKAVPEVLAQIQVVPSDDGMVYISSPQYVGDQSVVYQISLTSKFWGNAAINELKYVSVISSLTNQNVKIAIKLRMDPDQWGAPCMVTPVSSLVDIAYSNRHLLIMVASIIVISLGTLYIYVAFIKPFLVAPQPMYQLGNAHSHSPGFQTYLSPRSNFSPNDVSFQRSSPLNETPVYGDPRLLYSSPRHRNLSPDF